MDRHNRIQEISNAANYIEAGLDQPLTIAQIAKEVGLSPFHFQRLFFTSLGENVTDYIRRRRLERGANLLLENPSQSVIDIALQAGFESHSAFSRAFKGHFGKSPTTFRDQTKSQDGSNKRPFLVPTKSKQLDIQPDLMALPALWLIYRKMQGMKDGSYFPEQGHMLKAFNDLNVESANTPGFWTNCGAYQGGPKTFSDNSATGYYGGLFEQRPDLNWSEHYEKLAPGKWAVFPHYGDYEYLYLTWNKVIRNWLPGSSYELRDTWAFETYLEQPDKIQLQNASAQIYIPIR